MKTVQGWSIMIRGAGKKVKYIEIIRVIIMGLGLELRFGQGLALG